jgi:PEGA domain-containing protein
MNHAKSVLALALIASLGGCAAVLGTKSKDFAFNSNPGGATVVVNGSPSGTTPVTLHLSNLKEHVIVFHKEGFQDATCTLTKGTGGGWVILDVVMGLVPVIIDAATNNWSQTKGSGCTQQLVPVTVAQ